MEFRQEGIQETFDRLTSYDDERRELVKVERARAVFIRQVFKRVDSKIMFKLDPPEKIRQVLSKWAGRKAFCVWMSEWLPVHLDLPVSKYPDDCCILQGLILGEGLPPVFLTLYTQDSVDEDLKKSEDTLGEMRDFCTRCAKTLTLSLLNFCHREFLLLPCTMSNDADFTAEALQKEIEGNLGEAREFYGGPEELGKDTYEDLVRAVSVVATATTVPCYLRDEPDQNKEWLVSIDRDWDRAMRHVINRMLGNSQVTLTYTPQTEIKTKSAVLEVAKRISYTRRVAVVTSNDRVQTAVRRLVQAAEEENGLDPDFFRSAHPGDSIPRADCVIAVDVDDVTKLQTENLKMVVLKQPTKLDQKERVRVLLIGRSMSGKSATANTLLGETFFESNVSFSSITTASATRRRTYQGREIEVVDSPGIRDVTTDKGVDIDFLTRGEADSGLGFDVICYVMRIERFTEEEDKVFWRMVEVLGQSVLRRMILVFTCGDRIPNNDSIAAILAQAPERLKKIVEQCQQRYVVFDNISPHNRSQLDEFLEMVRRLDCKEPFFCPSAAEMEENWERSYAEDRQRRRNMLTRCG